MQDNINETVKKSDIGSRAWVAAFVHVTAKDDEYAFLAMVGRTERPDGVRRLAEANGYYDAEGVTRLGLRANAISIGYKRLANSKGPAEPLFEKVLSKTNHLMLKVHDKEVPWADRPQMFTEFEPADRRAALALTADVFSKVTQRLFKLAAEMGGCRDLPAPYGKLRATVTGDSLQALKSLRKTPPSQKGKKQKGHKKGQKAQGAA